MLGDKCDCGCGRMAVLEFNKHYFHEWACTKGYRKEEEQDADARSPTLPATHAG